MRVHRNLNKACWSLTRKGEPVKHVTAFAMVNVTFIVSEKQRQRVLRQKRRAVHAWAEGEKAPCLPPPPPREVYQKWTEVNYNPYRFGFFTRRDTYAVINHAAFVVFWTDGKCYTVEGGAL